jgi:hypothetical protein
MNAVNMAAEGLSEILVQDGDVGFLVGVYSCGMPAALLFLLLVEGRVALG